MKLDINLGKQYVYCTFLRSDITSFEALANIMYTLVTGHLQSDTFVFHEVGFLRFCEAMEPNKRYAVHYDQSGSETRLSFGLASAVRKAAQEHGLAQAS